MRGYGHTKQAAADVREKVRWGTGVGCILVSRSRCNYVRWLSVMCFVLQLLCLFQVVANGIFYTLAIRKER